MSTARLHLPGAQPLEAPPCERLRVRLELTRPVRFGFLHGGAIHGLFCTTLGHDLPRGVAPAAPESGRVRFPAGAAYTLGATLVGEAAGLAPRLLAELAHRGVRAPRPGVTLGGNFRLQEAERLPPLDASAVEAEAVRLAALPAVRVRFLSPLRLSLPEELAAPGATYFNQESFPARIFLQRLWQRWHLAARGEFPRGGEVPEPPAAARARPRGLVWVDLPIRGPRAGRPGRPRGMTLGGVLGEVELSGLDASWCALLALGRHLHLGRSTHYGLGRYALPDLGGPEAEPFRPAVTTLERIATRRSLELAFRRAVRGFERPGVDGETPDSFAGREAELLGALGAQVREGRYRPLPLAGREGRSVRGVPALRDLVVQEAFAASITGSLACRLEESSAAFRRGLSCAGSRRALAQAFEDGFSHLETAETEAPFNNVPRKRMVAKLLALLPLEPAVDLVERWLASPVRVGDREVHLTHGLPAGSPLLPLLVRLMLEEVEAPAGERLVWLEDRLVRLRQAAGEASLIVALAGKKDRQGIETAVACSAGPSLPVATGRKTVRVLRLDSDVAVFTAGDRCNGKKDRQGIETSGEAKSTASPGSLQREERPSGY